MQEKILDNTSLHYWTNEIHSEICVFFSHGVTADHRCFKKQEEYFENKYKIINWDIPMHGKSVNEKFISYEKCAEFMKRIIDKENVKQVILIGLSLGGYPSQMFAHIYPENTKDFIAVDTTPFGLEYYSKSDIFWLKQTKRITKCFPESLLKKSMAKSVTKTKYSYELMTEMLKNTPKNLISEQMGIAYCSFISENRDINFNFPILILIGEYDKTGKIKKYCRKWQKNINCPLHTITDASHFSNSDNSTAVNNEIECFIKSLIF